MPRVKLRVKRTSQLDRLEEQPDSSYIAYISSPPIDGKANKRIIEMISKHLDVPLTSISIVQGKKSKIKILEID